MSEYRPDAILGAITALLHGFIGAVRRVPPKMFQDGVFEGQDPDVMRAAVLDINYQHRFDVKIVSGVPHESTPVSACGPSMNQLDTITIDIWTRLDTRVQQAARREQRVRLLKNINTAKQALTYRNNLLADDNGVPTGIVSGMLTNPDGTFRGVESYEVSEDWTAGIHRARIDAGAIVEITQPI